MGSRCVKVDKNNEITAPTYDEVEEQIREEKMELWEFKLSVMMEVKMNHFL